MTRFNSILERQKADWSNDRIQYERAWSVVALGWKMLIFNMFIHKKTQHTTAPEWESKENLRRAFWAGTSQIGFQESEHMSC